VGCSWRFALSRSFGVSVAIALFLAMSAEADGAPAAEPSSEPAAASVAAAAVPESPAGSQVGGSPAGKKKGKGSSAASGFGDDPLRDDFTDNFQKVPDTPRTRQACKKLGLTVADLQFRKYESFYIPGDLREKQLLRFKHYDKKRKERLQQVMAERGVVEAENARRGEIPTTQTEAYLGMMESLLQKEAQRLEHDLKAQLRAHSNSAKENELQLEKEERLRKAEDTVQLKRQANKEYLNMVSEKTRSSANRRAKLQNENISQLEAKFEEEQAKFGLRLVGEKDRLKRFEEEKQGAHMQTMGKYIDKIAGMKVKTAAMAQERIDNGERSLDMIRQRIDTVAASRDAQARDRALRSEEQHLHIMDVRSQKDRIDRMNGYRAETLRGEIDGKIEQIETMLALKDQLQDQRKARTTKMESTKGSRGLSLRKDCPLGPGRYEQDRDAFLIELPVPKMRDSNVSHEQYINDITKVRIQNPPPGAYDPDRMPNGDRVERSSKLDVILGKCERRTYLDEEQAAKKPIPAPGRYEVKASLDPRATKMRRKCVDDKGLDEKDPKNYRDWMRAGTITPGPAGYSVDKFTRGEGLKRSQRSLPNLTREMLRGP